jgi:hypothetical protein
MLFIFLDIAKNAARGSWIFHALLFRLAFSPDADLPPFNLQFWPGLFVDVSK